MREGAGRLARPHGRIDPAFIEEAAGDIRHGLGEIAIGVEDEIARLVPAIDTRIGVGQRRVTIPVIERIAAELLRLPLVETVRQARIG